MAWEQTVRVDKIILGQQLRANAVEARFRLKTRMSWLKEQSVPKLTFLEYVTEVERQVAEHCHYGSYRSGFC